MKLKLVFFLVSILGLIATGFFFGKNLDRVKKPLNQILKREETYLFPDFPSEKANRIELSKEGERKVFLKLNAEWREENATTSAKPELFKNILDAVKELKKSGLVSRNPQKRAIFNVDEQGLEVIIKKDLETLAHFYVGKRGQDFLSNYYRKEGEDEVYLSSKLLDQIFMSPLNPQQ